jgi:predicted acetyltransferase
MSLKLRWVGEEDFDRVALVRTRCYAKASKEEADFQKYLRAEDRGKPGDFLLAERADGEAVGTTTSYSFTMWVRGAPLSCQGVAYVGTVRTARRAAGLSNGGAGVATELMHETLRKARERQQVVSALMPFRASFYEHFGYGLAETRAEWTIPADVMPRLNHDGLRYVEPADHDAITALRQRVVESGQCDLEITRATMDRRWRDFAGDGFEFVDRPGRDSPAHMWISLEDAQVNNQRYLRADWLIYESPQSLRRLLAFLGAQKDQFAGVVITLPRDVPMNQLLRETQVPHRPVVHATTSVRPYTRMQVRVLDHVRFFEKLQLPAKQARGEATIAVKETEGNVSKFRLAIESGRTRATPSDASPDIECRDVTWSSIACGELAASTAARWGLIQVNRPTAVELLDTLGVGPAPFCNEFF